MARVSICKISVKQKNLQMFWCFLRSEHVVVFNEKTFLPNTRLIFFDPSVANQFDKGGCFLTRPKCCFAPPKKGVPLPPRIHRFSEKWVVTSNRFVSFQISSHFPQAFSRIMGPKEYTILGHQCVFLNKHPVVRGKTKIIDSPLVVIFCVGVYSTGGIWLGVPEFWSRNGVGGKG